MKGQMSGQMNDLEEIESMLDNPLIMVSAIPVDDDSQASGNASGLSSVLNKSKTPVVKQVQNNNKPRHVPEALKHPTSQSETLKARIRVFWILRFLTLFLTQYDAELNKRIKVNPMLAEQREIEKWTEGQHVKLGN